jgi:hypothetical protein
MSEKGKKERRPAITAEQLKQLQEMAETIRYGTISLVFQDGLLIQIDKNEKFRISN